LATPTVFSYTIRDNDGVKASAPFYVSYDGAVETFDGLIGEWLVLGALLDAVTGGVIEGGQILVPLDADGAWKTTPLTGHSVSDTLNLNLGNDEDIRAFGEVVPALRDTLVSGGRPIVTAGDAIQLLVAALIGGFTNGNFSTSWGAGLSSWIDAFQGVRKHRKQLTARSKVIL
jgi:hypothetical protein